MSRNDYNYKRTAIRTAKDLHYCETTINRIKNATTESEIAHIMENARKTEL